MNKKTLLALLVGAVAVVGAVGFYIWNEKVRPEVEQEKRQQEAMAKSCKVHQAASKADLAMLDKMFQAGCSMNERNEFGMTPLHVVGSDRAAEYLISKGAYVDARDGRGYTPLKVMEMSNRKAVADLLKRHGAKH